MRGDCALLPSGWLMPPENARPKPALPFLRSTTVGKSSPDSVPILVQQNVGGSVLSSTFGDTASLVTASPFNSRNCIGIMHRMEAPDQDFPVQDLLRRLMADTRSSSEIARLSGSASRPYRA